MAASNRCQAKGHVGEKQELVWALFPYLSPPPHFCFLFFACVDSSRSFFSSTLLSRILFLAHTTEQESLS